MAKVFSQKYILVEITSDDLQYIKELYKWQCEEKYREYYTCRPLKKIPIYEDYIVFIKNHIKKGIKFFVLIKKGQPDILYGKITLFDYNERNYSAEFGYYLPEKNRGIGIGKIMIRQFIQLMFNDNSLELHKLYATTASGNKPSVKILEDLSFKLDGRLRDHYWIGDNIQDQLHYSILREEWN